MILISWLCISIGLIKIIGIFISKKDFDIAIEDKNLPIQVDVKMLQNIIAIDGLIEILCGIGILW